LTRKITKTAHMKYDFDKLIPRRGTHSYKWDTPENDDVLPMWVADMDFQTAPAVIEALRQRAEHGIFGYAKVPNEFYATLSSWFSRRHGWKISREHVVCTPGVVPALSAIIKALTVPDDKVIVQTPAYNCFFSSIKNNGCALAENPLIFRNGRWQMNFDDLEKKAADPAAKIFLLCNPHNPVGRVWTADELHRVGEICRKHGVFVVADEIHCEFVFDGNVYTPFATLAKDFPESFATCVSPSKAFNLAGLQIASTIVPDKKTREKFLRTVNDNEVCDVGAFGIEAAIAAYNDSEEWLNALLAYLWENYKFLRTFFEKRLPQFPVSPLEGTYLAWIDCRVLGDDAKNFHERLLHQEKLMLSPGEIYGSDGFVRLNFACPRERLADGLERFFRAVSNR